MVQALRIKLVPDHQFLNLILFDFAIFVGINKSKSFLHTEAFVIGQHRLKGLNMS